ncbi:DUF3500 domain-containing protein [Humibacter sp. RRB41]|uniref:DUF3500 domain-containing protein n=1 Tax=Humibacter sp. RRB41 TaxID=2919946 RepID=UPI001FA9D0F3|nr:DUF3500 domain-containing protein [Humibacter sp. RRB41]
MKDRRAASSADNDIDSTFSSDRVAGRADGVAFESEDFRDYLYPLDDPMLVASRELDYQQFSADKESAPFLADLLRYWQGLYDEPFEGVTTDGVVRRGLYESTQASVWDAEAAAAASVVVDLLPAVRHPIDAHEWRAWSNPEFVVHRVGVRLEELSDDQVTAVLRVVEASLSPAGFTKVTGAMALNGMLGELVEVPRVLNERSYWFSVFGTPEVGGTWGWQLFGHHVAVNWVSDRGRQTCAPVFLGAEPAVVDGAGLFDERVHLALDLAGSWDAAQRQVAVVYASVLDEAMPQGRLHPADERHVAGAFRDNRVIPYEGVRCAGFTEEQWAAVRGIVADCLLQRDPGPMLALVDRNRDETWVSWYGATDGSQPFYLRVQSPVVLAELDHHAGVWLNNRLPARFHIHTTLRHPNGGDYGGVLAGT